MMRRNFSEVFIKIYRHRSILDRHSETRCNEGLGTISFNHPLETINGP